MRRGLAIAGLLAVVVYGLITLLTRFREPAGFTFYGVLWLTIVHLSYWYLFSRIEAWTESRYPRPESAPRRVTLYALSSLSLGVLVFNVIYAGLRWLEPRVGAGDGEMTPTHLLVSSGLGAILSAVVAAIVLAQADSRRWQQAEIALRTLREERTALELGALRRQLDPHFLFNSLNTLTSLISEDPETATDFAVELADVYRHVLRTAEQELIPLRRELESMRSLAFLFEQRFENAFRLEVDIPSQDLDLQVVPLTLHTLLENAIEHNIVTRERPLTVAVRSRGGQLEVRNPHQAKERPRPRAQGGVGLENLRRSYELLASPGAFRVDLDGGDFTVRVPLLHQQPGPQFDPRSDSQTDS